MSSCVFGTGYPPVYLVQLQDQSLEDIVELFTHKIILDATNSTVEQALIDYVESVIEPVGWKGIWRAKPGSYGLNIHCDFLVEVKDVSRCSLEVLVTNLSLLSTEYREMANVQELLQSDSIIVPLIELYTVSENDSEQSFYITATVIEHVRFFYDHIWKPWDDPEDDNEEFARKINPRVRLFLDMTTGSVSSFVEERVRKLLREGRRCRQLLDSIKAKHDLDNPGQERDLDSGSVMHMIINRASLDNLACQMDIIENPELRNIMVEHTFSQQLHEPHTWRDGNIPNTLLVAETFNLSMLKSLNMVNDDVPLQFHHNLGAAIKAAEAGDTILLFPGTHRCVGLPWLEKSVSIEGIGDCDKIILLPVDVGDIFVNCVASDLSICNVTIRTTGHMQSVLVIHSGTLRMENCVIDGTHANVCIQILSLGKLHMRCCHLAGAKADGIAVRRGGHLQASSCTVTHCGKSGVTLARPKEGDAITRVELKECTMQENGLFDLVIVLPASAHGVTENIKTVDLADKFPGLCITVEKCVLAKNGTGECGVQHE